MPHLLKFLTVASIVQFGLACTVDNAGLVGQFAGDTSASGSPSTGQGPMEDPSNTTSTTGGPTSNTDPSRGGKGTGGSSTSGPSGEVGPGFLFDVARDEGSTTDSDSDACTKVDFLFVVDSSGSMEPHQQNLINSYDGFIQGITNHFGPDSDFHIGVVSADSYQFNIPECTEQLGSLITQVPSEDLSETIDCSPYAEGFRFMTEEDDLAEAFSCTANVSAEGDDVERPIRSAINALSPAMNAPGACNEGFSRPDALLVVVIISNDQTLTDADADANPFTDTSGWYPDMVALKGGSAENIVVIGFVASGDTWCIPFGYDGNQAPNYINFIQAFGDNGSVHNVCDEDYGPEFMMDVDLVLDACNEFVPPQG